MNDIFQQWGYDLVLGPTGDLALVDDPVMGQQRILRRLLTNAGDYIWQLDYGAGLAGFIGQTVNSSQISALIRSQIFKEPSVARTPEPVIDVTVSPGGVSGEVYVYISYVDATSGQTQLLSFSASA
jgi:hypothetical protein